METETTAKRGPGRPRKVQTTVTRQEFDDAEDTPDEASDDGSFTQLFDTGKIAEKSLAKIRVIRKEPDEGMLGYLQDANASEAEILERWGGGTFRLEGLNQRGLIKLVTTIKLAGDPIFQSVGAEHQWRKAKGLPNGVPVTGDKGMSFQEMLAFIQSQESERSQRQREHDASMRKLELEAETQKRREDDERERRRAREDEERELRRRKDDEARDDKRKKDDEERDARRRRDTEEASARQQQFMQQTITMIQQSSNQALQFVKATAEGTPKDNPNSLIETVKVVMAIKDAFGGEGGDEPSDPLSLVLKHGGEWLNGIGNAVSGAIREVKGGGVAGAAATAQHQIAAPRVSLPIPPGPLADKVEQLVTKIAARGQDPEKVLNQIVDNLLTVVDRPQSPTAGTTVGASTVSQQPVHGAPVATGAVGNPVDRKSVRLQFGQAKRAA